ncbi:MAG: hypothetical protein BWY66_02821 [bacterium ADurb.Bin374]|nr:MAG: hypothetical protein BWY66_02821 [bacterium ADurb.Bin374]
MVGAAAVVESAAGAVTVTSVTGVASDTWASLPEITTASWSPMVTGPVWFMDGMTVLMS